MNLSERYRRSYFRNFINALIYCINLGKRFDRYLDLAGILDGFYAYKGPDFVQIDLTNNCNNNCIGCWCNSPLLEDQKINPLVKAKFLPFKRVIRLLDELYKMGTRNIYYAGGGEPFMHPHLMEILEYTKKKGFTCFVNTNFTFVDEKMVEKLINIRVDHLTVSVWAGSPQVYSLTHPNKGVDTFFKIKEMLKLLNRLKVKLPIIKVYHVVFNLNYHDIEPMIEFALETNSEAVEFTVIDTIPGKTDRLLLNKKETAILLDNCRRIKKRCDNGEYNGRIQLLEFYQFMRRLANVDSSEANYDSDVIGTIPCYVGWAFARILADGNVNSCLKSHRFPVGNILKDDFRKIWNNPLQSFFREKTVAIDKTDPFFSLIGNNINARMGCYKSCDNIGHNINMRGKLNSMPEARYRLLKNIVNYLKFINPVLVTRGE